MAIRGADQHRRRLTRMRAPAIIRPITRGLFAEAQQLAVDAGRSITAGAVSGKNHVPSAPGEPPNADTHVLDRSIRGELGGPLKAQTVADAPYAAAQEFGIDDGEVYLDERPYMRPAAAISKERAPKRLAKIVRQVIRGVQGASGEFE